MIFGGEIALTLVSILDVKANTYTNELEQYEQDLNRYKKEKEQYDNDLKHFKNQKHSLKQI